MKNKSETILLDVSSDVVKDLEKVCRKTSTKVTWHVNKALQMYLSFIVNDDVSDKSEISKLKSVIKYSKVSLEERKFLFSAKEVSDLTDATFLTCEALFGVKKEQIVSSSRVRAVADCRKFIIWLFRHVGMSCEQIGAIINRKHSTVSIQYEEFNALVNVNIDFKKKVKQCCNVLVYSDVRVPKCVSDAIDDIFNDIISIPRK